MTKSKRINRRAEPIPAFGEIDPMTIAAAMAGMTTCDQTDPADPHQLPCTRARGHAESNDSHHVSTLGGTTVRIWS